MSVENYNYDVLIVGTGNAACSAAHAALEKRARVGMLEKSRKIDRGGNSALTGHMRFVYDGIEDLYPLVKNMPESELRVLVDRMPNRTEESIWNDLMEVTNNQTDQELLEVHVTQSRSTVHWLASKGHDWVPSGEKGDNILSLNGGGYGLQQRNFAMLETAGVVFHCETPAMELIEDNKGQVIGARALSPNGYQNFMAQSIVLACGSFEANPEMRARYLGPGWDTIRIRGVPFNTGDGLRMALDIGAMPYGSWTTCHAAPMDINLPVFSVPSGEGFGRSDDNRYMYPYCILVNVNGERFVDESENTRGKTYAKTGRAILAQPGGVAFQIMDAKIRKMGLYTKNYNKATTAKGDTLEKLAEELDINGPNLVKTVREFNAAVQPGKYNPDRLFLDGKCTAGIHPKKSNYALTIDEPPFEAWPVRCGMTFCYGGLKIEAKTGQVQHVAGRPVPGLYAAGEMVGGLFVGNYASGSGMMSGATFGRIAGTNAAIAAKAL